MLSGAAEEMHPVGGPALLYMELLFRALEFDAYPDPLLFGCKPEKAVRGS
jgi:hypothetical protein